MKTSFVYGRGRLARHSALTDLSQQAIKWLVTKTLPKAFSKIASSYTCLKALCQFGHLKQDSISPEGDVQKKETRYSRNGRLFY